MSQDLEDVRSIPGKLISLVVPVFNEEEAAPVFIAAVTLQLDRVRRDLGDGAKTEIIFVDDGSTDGTLRVLRGLSAPGTTIRLVHLSRNFGKEAALTAGLLYAKGDAVIPMDVDMQDPPELLQQMVAHWREGALIVNAVRGDRSSDDWVKRGSARVFYGLFNKISSYRLNPNVGDFRLLDRRVVETLNALPEKVRFMKGLFSWVGYRTAEVTYVRPERSVGSTKWKMLALWNFALDGITGASTLPLRVWTYLGSLVAFFSFVYMIFLVVRTLLFGVDVPGYASTMAAILMIGSLNLIALGIIGEYVGRIAIEVRQRPLFVIDTVETLQAEENSRLPSDVGAEKQA